jgi:DNA-binding beta-propeller fold protein YncE
MSLPDPAPNLNPEAQHLTAVTAQEERKRRRLLLGLLLLLLGLCAVLYISVRYLMQPAPIQDLLPPIISRNLYNPPSFKFAVTGVDQPVGVGLSADGQRLYVAESGGERLIKMFDRDGKLIQSFAPPGTTPANRKPNYIAVNPDGRVFVSDNYNQVIDVFDPQGNFIDAIISVDMTLTKAVALKNNGAIPLGTTYFYSNLDKNIYYQLPNEEMKAIPITQSNPWAPLGLRFDAKGNLLVTNVNDQGKQIFIFPANAIQGSWLDFNPKVESFADAGQGDGQLSFSNSVVSDSKGNIYVSDGNNGRISLWNPDHTYRTFFGYGSDSSSFNLPRGMWIDDKDRLHITDAVGQSIRVYDVSQAEPIFIYSFGDFGIAEGKFNYPTDIVIDNGGRLYIADRENNRVQVWSY